MVSTWHQKQKENHQCDPYVNMCFSLENKKNTLRQTCCHHLSPSLLPSSLQPSLQPLEHITMGSLVLESTRKIRGHLGIGGSGGTIGVSIFYFFLFFLFLILGPRKQHVDIAWDKDFKSTSHDSRNHCQYCQGT